jgi:hypothetical protein
MQDSAPLSDEQIAEIERTVASWPTMSDAARDEVAALFAYDGGES